MDKKIQNPCSRCGKERIITKTWEEEFQTFSGVIREIHSDSVCPDESCQAIIDVELASQKEKRDKQKKDREQRALDTKNKNHS